MFTSLKRKVEDTFSPSTSTKKPHHEAQANNAANREIAQQRKDLPIASARLRFLDQANRNDCFVLIGETGSGKTTQIPQFLLEGGFNRPGQCIAVTQPRRVAAISLSQRVGQERGHGKFRLEIYVSIFFYFFPEQQTVRTLFNLQMQCR